MGCYFLGLVDRHDLDTYSKYQAGNRTLIAGLDVKLVALTDQFEKLEGESDANYLVLLEFVDRKEFEKWWSSEDYAQLKPFRQQSSTTAFAAVFGEHA